MSEEIYLVNSPFSETKEYFTGHNAFGDYLRYSLLNCQKILLIVYNCYDAHLIDNYYNAISQAMKNARLYNNELIALTSDNKYDLQNLMENSDAVFVVGGDILKNNPFFVEIGLQKLLSDYSGVIIDIRADCFDCNRLSERIVEIGGGTYRVPQGSFLHIQKRRVGIYGVAYQLIDGKFIKVCDNNKVYYIGDKPHKEVNEWGIVLLMAIVGVIFFLLRIGILLFELLML